ncbi:CCA tRNA nucleotidyltransferase [Sphingomonas sp. RS6]
MILPDVEWRRREGLDRLTGVLGACDGLARFVGGAVRDAVLGVDVADVDIATVLLPEQVMERLASAGIRAVPTGLEHGTVTAVLPDGPVEVTTLRRDVSTDGRHAKVAFTNQWREDAARRDFTINALYADPVSGALFDFFGGLDDLAARRVRFIGDPMRRIAEDHLRILRFFRFLARFGDRPDPEGLAACTARARDLMALSRERIRDELLKLLVAADAVSVVTLMLEQGILAPVLPEIVSADRLKILADREARMRAAPDPIRRLAALLLPGNADGAAIAGRLKLSNAQRKRLLTAMSGDGLADPRGLAYRVGTTSAEDRMLLHSADPAQLAADWQALSGWQVPVLPLSGGALVERGLARGPDVARALRAVEDRWIAEGFPDASRVAALADDAVAQALRAAISAKASSAGTGRE